MRVMYSWLLCDCTSNNKTPKLQAQVLGVALVQLELLALLHRVGAVGLGGRVGALLADGQ